MKAFPITTPFSTHIAASGQVLHGKCGGHDTTYAKGKYCVFKNIGSESRDLDSSTCSANY